MSARRPSRSRRQYGERDRLADGKVHVTDRRLFRARDTIMAVVVPKKRQWTRRDIITHSVPSMRPFVLSLSTTTTTTFLLISPRSPVDSLSLPFLPNVCTHSFSTSRLRLGDIDLPQTISRATPSPLVGLDRLSHPFSLLCHLPTPVL